MSPVPDRVLHWLYNNLKSQYTFADRTYSDIVSTLTTYSSLSPKTDVYTYDDGSSALLLQLHGTLPVRYRKAEYRYPIALWLPKGYPQQAPMPYVVPTNGMLVRPGQHVSTEGRVYHPYIAQWGSHWERASVSALVQLLFEIFAKEPPLCSPPDEAQRPSSTSLQLSDGYARHNQAPRPPPKVSAGLNGSSEARLVKESSNAAPHERPPSLPPKPLMPPTSDSNGQYSDYRDPPTQTASQGFYSQNYVQEFARPGTHNAEVNEPQRRQRSPFQNNSTAAYSPGPYSQRSSTQLGASVPFVPPYHKSQLSSEYVSQAGSVLHVKKPIEDLMSSPMESTASATTNMTSMPAPPIPPNPEKDALLRTISASLVSQIGQIASKNMSAIPSLESQHTAMYRTHQDMESELSQLKSLDTVLSSNENILHHTLLEADKKMESVRNKEKPNVDEVLVAPTLVAEQLYGLVAEEQSLGDALFALTKAMDKGRVSAEVYIKQTRTLAREQFLKKALIRKIARGLRLDGV